MQEPQLQLQPQPRPQPRPVQVMEEAPLLAPAATLGVYDTARMAEDPFRWAEAVRAAWLAAPEGSEERRVYLELRALLQAPADAPHRADEPLRRQLWGAAGAASDASLVAQGVRHFHAQLLARFEHMDEATRLVETVRCYGDYLAYYHPDGQTQDGPPFAVYAPFRDMLAPAWREPTEEATEVAAPAPACAQDLRAQLLAELNDPGDTLAPPPTPDVDLAHHSRPSALLLRPETRPEHLRPQPSQPPSPSRLTQLKDAARRHAPAVVVSTLALTVLDLMRGAR